MKLALKVLGLVLLAYMALTGVRSIVIHNATGPVVKRLTGFEATIDGIDMGFLRPSFEITGLKLFNPPDFPTREALEIRRAYVRFSPGLLLRDEIRLPEVALDLANVVVVRNADGEYNLARLGEAVTPADGKARQPDPGEESAPEQALRIDTLTIKVGKAQFIDYRHKNKDGTPRIRTADMQLERTYTDVTSLNGVALKLVAEILANEAVGIVNNVAGKLKSGGDVEKLDRTAKKIGDSLNRMFKKTKPSD